MDAQYVQSIYGKLMDGKLTMKAIADVYTECQLDKAERFRKKFVTGLAPRSRKINKKKKINKYS